MSFQSSAQSIGFKSRPVSESSGRTRARAQNIATAGSRKVDRLREQASSRQQEEQRQSGLASQRETYELDKLRDFSSTLQGLWNDVQETVVKEHVKEKRAEGLLLGQKAAAGDEEALAQIALNKQQNAQIQEQVNKQMQESGALADSIEITEYKASLEEKARANNIRRLGNNVAYGFNVATLQAKAQDFPNWFDNHVKDSDQTYTIDGVEYTANQYNSIQDGEIKSKLLDQIAVGYVEENSNGIRDSLVVENLSASIGEQTANMKVSITAEAKEATAVQELDDVRIQFKTLKTLVDGAALDPNSTDGLALQEKLGALYERMYSLNRRLPQGLRKDTAGHLFYDVVKDFTSELVQDPTAGDADISDMMTVLKTMKFNKGNQGLKTLGEHHPGINWDKLEADAINKKHEATTATITAARASFNARESQYIREMYEDMKEPKNLPQDQAIKQYQEKVKLMRQNPLYGAAMDNGGSSGRGTGGEHGTHVPVFFTADIAEDAAAQAILEHGHINYKDTLKWPQSVVDKYKDKIVRENYAEIQVPGSPGSNALLNNQVKIQNALRASLKTNNKNQYDSSQYQRAYDWILKQQIVTAKRLQLEAEKDPNRAPISETEALKQAGTYWVSRIEADADGTKPQDNSSANANDGKSFVPSGKDGEFAGGDWVAPVVKYASSKEEIQANLQQAVSHVNNKSGDVFKEKIPGIRDEDLNYNKDTYSNGYNDIFNELEKYDRYDRTPFQLLNAQRVARGLEPYNWEEVDPDAHNAIVQWEQKNPQIKELLKSGSELSIDRALAKQDVMSVNAMTTVLQAEPFPETRFSKDLLREVGLDENLTLEQINDPANADIKTRLIKHEVNRLGQLADVTTQNSHTMVRMVYTGFFNTDDDMKTWNQGPGEGKTDFDSNSRQALNRYLSGSTAKEDTFVSAFQKGESEASFQGLIKQETPPNTPDGGIELAKTLSTLRKQKPEPRIVTTRGASQHRGTSKTNPEYVIWEQKMFKLESTQRVRQVAAEGGNFDKRDIRRLLGPDVYKQLETQAINEYESKNTGKRKRGEVRPWSTGFNKLLTQKLKEKEVI